MLSHKLILLTFLLIGSVLSIIIDTPNGQIQGVSHTMDDGKKVAFFKKIPFAQAPLGQLRYAMARHVFPWNNILNATEYGPACPQSSTTSSYKPAWIDEDCLHVNVFTSYTCLENKNCPVIFYIHGGGMNYDSPVMFDDDILFKNYASNDVVLVLVAFRLGQAGLLTFETDDVVPFNLALHDVIHGLEWVQENAVSFGGDNRQVTLMGHSMGSATSLALMFSKSIDPEKRLFQKAICMSGSISFSTLDQQTGATNAFARASGCLVDEEMIGKSSVELQKSVVECLRRKDWQFLLKVQREIEEQGIVMTGFSRTQDLFPGKSFGDFLNNPPDRPMILGLTVGEFDFPGNHDSPIVAAAVAGALGYKHVHAISKKYTTDVEKQKLGFNHSLETQVYFLGVSEIAEKMTASGGDVYLYSYKNSKHAGHVDYLSYFMGVHSFEQDENEAVLAVVLPRMWINFVKTGKPNDDWKPMVGGIRNYYYLDVNIETNLMPHNEPGFEKEVNDYWKKDIAHFDQFLSRVNTNIQEKFEKKKIKDKIVDYSKTKTMKELKSKVDRKRNRVRNPLLHGTELKDTSNPEIVLENSSTFDPFSFSSWQVLLLLLFTGLGFIIGSIWSASRRPRQVYVVDEKRPLNSLIF